METKVKHITATPKTSNSRHQLGGHADAAADIACGD